MKQSEALFVLSQAQQDRRIAATLQRSVAGGRLDADKGYRVRLELLYRERILIARTVREWQDIKSIWSEL